ncbi:Esterase [Gammaproteobacteria bacterium]
MFGMRCHRSTILPLLVFGLSACMPLQQYRTQYSLCVNSGKTPLEKCEAHAIQKYQEAASDSTTGQEYLLNFVEFDDQGMLFDRKQMEAVLNSIYEEALTKDLLIAVFMHGWKHSAAPGDSSVEAFRSLLARLDESEKRLSQDSKETPRQVVGVYLGWRGVSVTVPILEHLSFWERKNTAQKLGETGVAEVLSQLERIKLDKDSMVAGGSRTRMAMIGHGLGGTAMYGAVAHTLSERFLQTTAPEGTQGDVRGVGNLVILINPSFPALQFAPLSNMAAARGSYFGSQLPVLAILTSETDYISKLAFSWGRRFSTFFENEREISRWNAVTRKEEELSEKAMNLNTPGNFLPFLTHSLHPTEEFSENANQNPITEFHKIYSAWVLDYPGSQIEFNGTRLQRAEQSAGRNPYLVIQVNRELLKDHGDLSDRRNLDFVNELMLISCQTPKMIEKTRSETQSLIR